MWICADIVSVRLQRRQTSLVDPLLWSTLQTHESCLGSYLVIACRFTWQNTYSQPFAYSLKNTSTRQMEWKRAWHCNQLPAYLAPTNIGQHWRYSDQLKFYQRLPSHVAKSLLPPIDYLWGPCMPISMKVEMEEDVEAALRDSYIV